MEAMKPGTTQDWKRKVVEPRVALDRIEPGMNVFLGTGVAEPRTLVKEMMSSQANNLQDLELIQLVSLGDAISIDELGAQQYRLKTFFSGWVASEAITAGRVDLIPSRFSKIPRLIRQRFLDVDAAFVQITPPNEQGYCSLGLAVDVAREAMERASLVVGEMSDEIPFTYGDSFVSLSEFDLLVESKHPPITIPRVEAAPVFEQVAANVASVIDDGCCLSFSVGPLYEALARKLEGRKHLGIHSAFVTDAVMDLVRSGAVSNRRKGIFRGKCSVSYALGTPELMRWLDHNPLVEFQGLEKTCGARQIGRNPDVVTVLPARTVDISGRVVMHAGRGNIVAEASEAAEFLRGAEISEGGRTVIALPSRNKGDESNICLSVEEMSNQLGMRESIDMVVTEYGVATLRGRTVRGRAQAIIDIAHPDDRAGLVEEAKRARILYPDQIFLEDSAHLYPADVETTYTFKGGQRLRFRAIKPSDEEQMRRLFYRFSDRAVYYRYFSPIKTMPHAKMQQYVNVDYSQVMSVVGLVGPAGEGHIVAEARFVNDDRYEYADLAFVVDEEYAGLGIATYLYRMMIRLAKERGITGFHADVLATNKGMMKVIEKGGLPVNARLDEGIYSIDIPFSCKS